MHVHVCMCVFVCLCAGARHTERRRENQRDRVCVCEREAETGRETFKEGRVRREKHMLLMRLCSHMLAPSQSLQPLLMRLCSRMRPFWSYMTSVAYAYRESADV